jgi:hypothetical protein
VELQYLSIESDPRILVRGIEISIQKVGTKIIVGKALTKEF